MRNQVRRSYTRFPGSAGRFVTDVFNSLQGVLIFLLVILRGGTRRQMALWWRQLVRRQRHLVSSSRRSRSASASSRQTASTSASSRQTPPTPAPSRQTASTSTPTPPSSRQMAHKSTSLPPSSRQTAPTPASTPASFCQTAALQMASSSVGLDRRWRCHSAGTQQPAEKTEAAQGSPMVERVFRAVSRAASARMSHLGVRRDRRVDHKDRRVDRRVDRADSGRETEAEGIELIEQKSAGLVNQCYESPVTNHSETVVTSLKHIDFSSNSRPHSDSKCNGVIHRDPSTSNSDTKTRYDIAATSTAVTGDSCYGGRCRSCSGGRSVAAARLRRPTEAPVSYSSAAVVCRLSTRPTVVRCRLLNSAELPNSTGLLDSDGLLDSAELPKSTELTGSGGTAVWQIRTACVCYYL